MLYHWQHYCIHILHPWYLLPCHRAVPPHDFSSLHQAGSWHFVWPEISGVAILIPWNQPDAKGWNIKTMASRISSLSETCRWYHCKLFLSDLSIFGPQSLLGSFRWPQSVAIPSLPAPQWTGSHHGQPLHHAISTVHDVDVGDTRLKLFVIYVEKHLPNASKYALQLENTHDQCVHLRNHCITGPIVAVYHETGRKEYVHMHMYIYTVIYTYKYV